VIGGEWGGGRVNGEKEPKRCVGWGSNKKKEVKRSGGGGRG